MNTFSFREHAVRYQSPEQTLLILVYEIGKMIEYHHKANIYGATGYYSLENQKKEASDSISMFRYYCEMKGWNFDELMKLGEECYLERMQDIKKYGVKNE